MKLFHYELSDFCRDADLFLRRLYPEKIFLRNAQRIDTVYQIDDDGKVR